MRGFLADLRKTLVADIRNAHEGDPFPANDGGRLVAGRGVVLAESSVLDEGGGKASGSTSNFCRISLLRTMAAIAQNHHDAEGLVWPAIVAPFSVVVTSLASTGETFAAAERIYSALNAAGIDTILDDRDERPGVKFIEADLIGFPVRVTVGERGLKEGLVEIRSRSDARLERVPPVGVVQRVSDLLLRASL